MSTPNTGKLARRGVSLIFAVAAQAMMTLSAADHSPTPSRCVFQANGDGFSGTCGTLFDETPSFTVARSLAVKSGIWRDDIRPNAVWVGTMTEDSRRFFIELDIYDGERGILRTEYGWFAVSHFIGSSGLMFELDASREIKPNILDQKIVERAAALLSSTATWNRADNRVCPNTASTWSIYCAMWHATIEVTGAADHRRPALEVVREVVEARSAGRGYSHRLMDYNNDPRTRIEDVQSLFREAIAGMNDRTWLAKHGFATSSEF